MSHGAPHAADLQFRPGRRADLEAIVKLLADDFLGEQREALTLPLPASYELAFDAILEDPNNEVLVACIGDEIVASLQLTYTPSLSYRGSWRATIESVRTTRALRGRGIGSAFLKWTIDRARDRGCRLVQLSTNRHRPDAIRFYERLGFSASHAGMKLDLQPDATQRLRRERR